MMASVYFDNAMKACNVKIIDIFFERELFPLTF